MAASAVTNSCRINLRATPDAKALIEKAAELMGTTLSAYMLQNSYEAAKRLIADHQMLMLSNRDRDAFLAAISKAPKPNAALRKLMRK